MFFSLLALLLGIASMASSAAFVPVRPDHFPVLVSTECPPASTTTVYLPTTVYSPPQTITIALENMTSVSESLSSVASIDSAQVSAASEFAPLSEVPATTATQFTHTIIAPLVEATKASNSSSGVYYVSIGQNTTNWSYTPTESTVVGTTTVTVLPIPTGPSNSNLSTTTISTTTYTTITTSRSRPVFSFAAGGPLSSTTPCPWPNITHNTTVFGGASGAAKPSVSLNTTITTYVTVATTTVDVTVYPSTVSVAHDKRQICTLVYAVIDNNLASWCNNWDGHTVFYHSTYTSTVTPSQFATAMPATVTSSQPASQLPSSSPKTSLATVTVESTVNPTQVSASVLSTSASSTFSAPAAATSCGQVGTFEINFDNLPAYSPSNNDTADFPPIFNPYEHFFWANGWAYGPPPNEPFTPESGGHLAEFVPSVANNNTNSPDAGDVPSGAFGAGPRAYNNNYWFDAHSAYAACDNGDPSITCDFVATAYQWDPVNYKESVVATEHFSLPACAGFKNCTLNQIFFDEKFTKLSSLAFYANVQGQLKIFWVDTLEVEWWNNTCAAGLARISSE